jgi:hypothetical protein
MPVYVGGAGVHLGACLAVGKEKIERNCRGELAFTVLFADLDISSAKLPETVLIDDAEDVPDNLFLPWHQLKRLTVPFAVVCLSIEIKFTAKSARRRS